MTQSVRRARVRAVPTPPCAPSPDHDDRVRDALVLPHEATTLVAAHSVGAAGGWHARAVRAWREGWRKEVLRKALLPAATLAEIRAEIRSLATQWGQARRA